MAIPVIEMGNLKGNEKERFMAEMGKACEEVGFFQLKGHSVPLELMERVKKVCSEHYNRVREPKFKTESVPVKLLNKSLTEAELSNSSEPKKVENVDWEDCFVLQYAQEDYPWPSEPSEFKETMMEFGKEITKLAETLLEILSENLGLEKGYLKTTLAGGDGPDDKAFFGTKISHYPPCPRPELVEGLRAHTDAGGLILLFQDDEVGGLQVLDNTGRWIDAPPMKDTLVIDIGDQLEAISNGRYRSAWHRVLATDNGNRMSVASFYNPSFDAVISPAPQLILQPKEGSELSLYPKFVFGDYMNVYAQQKFLPKEPRFQAVTALQY